MKPLTVAITGASGFVGGALARSLLADGVEVIAFGRRSPNAISPDLKEHYRHWDITHGALKNPPAVDAVVHCAGAVDDWGTFNKFYRANVTGTEHVLNTWPKARFVHVSSASIYDPYAPQKTIFEDDADPTDEAAITKVRYLNHYGRTKREAEFLVSTQARERSIILRPHAVYGPGDTTLMPRLLRRYRFGRLLMVGDPANRVALTHIDNFVHAIKLALGLNAHEEVGTHDGTLTKGAGTGAGAGAQGAQLTGAVNITDETVLELGEALSLVLKAAGRRERITWIPTKPAWGFASIAEASHLYGRLPRPIVTRYQLSHVTRELVFDLSRAREQLGYRAVVCPREALSNLWAQADTASP